MFQMGAHVLGVARQGLFTSSLVNSVAGIKESVQRTFGVDGEFPTAGHADDHVWPQAPFVRIY